MRGIGDKAIVSIIDTIKEAKPLLAEIGDIAIDTITNDETLKQIPVISWIIQANVIKNAYQLKRLQRNVKAFLLAAKNADSSKLQKLLEKLSLDNKYAEEFTDTTLSILIEGEKPIKAQILGNLIISLAKEEITKDEFDTMSLIVLSASVPAINALSAFFKKNKDLSHTHNSKVEEEPLLLSMGICSRNGTLFKISELGEKLYIFGIKGRQCL
jgi:hypothetical protein